MFRDSFDAHSLGVAVTIGIQWAEAGDAAKHPALQRTAPATRGQVAQNVDSDQAEKPSP